MAHPRGFFRRAMLRLPLEGCTGVASSAAFGFHGLRRRGAMGN